MRVRGHVYRLFVELERAPRTVEVAAELGLARGEVEASFRRLHDAHAIVLGRGSTEIRMALPFSGVSTDVRVVANGRCWYANCAWDGLGVLASLGADGRLLTHCSDCDDALELEVRGGALVPTGSVVHFVVPAARWWDDIAYT